MERLGDYTQSLAREQRFRSISRGLAAVGVAGLTRQHPDEIIERANWHKDRLAVDIAHRAVDPTGTSDFTAASRLSFLYDLAPRSPAIRLFEQCVHVDLTGVQTVNVPSATTMDVPIFYAAGAPFRMFNGAFTNAAVGPTCKVMIGAAVTNDLEFANPENASTIVGRCISAQAGKSLATETFSTTAASEIRSAGILADVVPITASAATGFDAMVEDIKNLAGAIAEAGGDSDRMMIFAAPRQAMSLKLSAGLKFNHTVIATNALDDGTVVGLDPNGIACGYSGVPEISLAREAVAHFEDTTPLALSAVGTPNTVAAPLLSAWQQNLLFIKMKTNLCWQVLVPGIVQVVNDVVW